MPWRSLALTLYLPTALGTLGFGAIIPLVPLTARWLGGSPAEAAFVVALFAVGGLLGALPAGALAHRFGERRALVGAMLVDAAAMAVAPFVTSLLVFMGLVLVVGLSGAVMLLARQSYLTEAVPYEFRARALSSLGGVFRLGSMIGPLLGAGVVSLWGLPAAYWMAAVTGLLAAAVTLTLRDLPPLPDLPDEPVRLGDVLRGHARTYLTIGVGAASIMLIRAARNALLPLWCDQHGLDAATTSLIFALSSSVDLALFYLGGSLMDRLGRRWVTVTTMVVMGACFALLPLAQTVWAIAAFAIGLGLGNGISSGAVMTLGSDASPALGRQQFLAGWRLTTGLGELAAPVVISALAAVASLSVAALAIGAIGFTGAAWLWRWVPAVDASSS